MKSGSGDALESINTRQGQSQEDSSLMNHFPQIPALEASRSLRKAVVALMFLLPAILTAQEVIYTAPGIISVGGVPPIYNGKYVIQKTDFGFMWLDTTSLQPGLVQGEAKCGVGQPASDTNIYVIGDCNGTTNVVTGDNLVVAGQFSGQCGVALQGCNGGRVNGTGQFYFRLGTFEYLGQDLGTAFTPSTATADLQGRTWKVVEGAEPGGYRSAVAFVGGTPAMWVAVGPSGSDVSLDDGKTWAPMSATGFHATAFAGPGIGWAVGEEGRIARFIEGGRAR